MALEILEGREAEAHLLSRARVLDGEEALAAPHLLLELVETIESSDRRPRDDTAVRAALRRVHEGESAAAAVPDDARARGIALRHAAVVDPFANRLDVLDLARERVPLERAELGEGLPILPDSAARRVEAHRRDAVRRETARHVGEESPIHDPLEPVQQDRARPGTGNAERAARHVDPSADHAPGLRRMAERERATLERCHGTSGSEQGLLSGDA